jgi:hypothetical protein
MHIHHALRGGLFLTGVGIGSLCIAASAGAGSHGVVTAPAAGVAVVTAPAPEVVLPGTPLPPAPAATPVLIQSVPTDEVGAEAVPVAPTVVEEAEPGSDPAPEVPVIQAGPGPATPVPGAITLIDPLVIVREPADQTA